MRDQYDATIPMPMVMRDAITEGFSGDDSLSGWVRGAIILRLQVEGMDDERLEQIRHECPGDPEVIPDGGSLFIDPKGSPEDSTHAHVEM